jgi:hypothetical protein
MEHLLTGESNGYEKKPYTWCQNKTKKRKTSNSGKKMQKYRGTKKFLRTQSAFSYSTGKVKKQMANSHIFSYLPSKRIHEEFLPQSKYKQTSYPTIESYKVCDLESDTCTVEIMILVKNSD